MGQWVRLGKKSRASEPHPHLYLATHQATKLQSGPPILDGVREIGPALAGGQAFQEFSRRSSYGVAGRVGGRACESIQATAREEAGAFLLLRACVR